MRAEIVAIGDELTSGVRLDTNSQWLSQQLQQAGIGVDYHTTVGDDLAAIVAALRGAVARADSVLVTGGLGPTADDLTRQALADVAGQPLVRHPEVVEHIRDLFARRGRTMPERNVIQAEFPAGSRVIDNPHGTAPGIHLQLPRSEDAKPVHLFALPGVPAEMRQMYHASVAGQLAAVDGDSRHVIHHRIIRCFGAGESDIEQRLPDLVRRGRSPQVGITASQATISLRITARAESIEACERAMAPTVATIYECLGPLIFGEGDDTLQDVVCRQLAERSLRLATAEWATQGLLASWLAAAPSATAYSGGIVVVDPASCDQAFGPVAAAPGSADDEDDGNAELLVRHMAVVSRRRLNADLGLAVGPPPERTTEDSRPPRIHFALATMDQVMTASSNFAAHPSIRLIRSAKQALDMARHWLADPARGS